MAFENLNGVIPAKAGIQTEFTNVRADSLDSRLPGNGIGRLLAIAFVVLAVGATPALATEWQHCADAGGAASFDYLAGDGLDVIAISALTVSAGEKVWASDAA